MAQRRRRRVITGSVDRHKALPAYQAELVHRVELPTLFGHLQHIVSKKLAVASFLDSPYSWNGNITFEQALQFAQYGWQDAPKIETLTLPVLKTITDDVDYFLDVTGQFIDIGEFCSGNPEHWQRAEAIEKQTGQVIKLAVEIGGCADITSERMANRGQAIIALINTLEMQGHSIELVLVRAFENGRHENYKFLIPIKEAGQAVDMKRLQFMIGHTAFFRRLMFGLTEIAQGDSMDVCGTSTRTYAPDGYIHIEHTAGLGACLSDSLKWAQDFALTVAA